MRGSYYNEIDPFAAEMLRNLIAAGHIAPGDVDERSIEDVRPDDLRGYAQCHFFAGVGVWSYALRRAGRIKAYGNAINAAQAEGFIRAVMECASP